MKDYFRKENLGALTKVAAAGITLIVKWIALIMLIAYLWRQLRL